MLALAAAAIIARVAEPSGAPASGVLVLLTQDGFTQARKTDAHGEARFRCREGAVKLTLGPAMPAGWVADPPTAVEGKASLGPPLRATFAVHANRTVAGRAFFDADGDGAFGPGDVPLADVQLRAGTATARSGRDGAFALSGLPAGRVQVRSDPPFAGGFDVDLPAAPAEAHHDLALGLERLTAGDPVRLRMGALHIVPQPPASRAIAAWAAEKPLSSGESAALTRLSALTNLDPGFRLLVVAPPAGDDPATTLRAASAMTRWLTGPGQVARERIAVVRGEGNLAPSGHLTLVLARVDPANP